MPGIPEKTQSTHRPPRWVSGRRWLGALALALAAALLPGAEARAYRFFEQTDNDSLIPVAATAVRWSADVWGSSDSLPWVVADSPGWTEPWVDSDEETQDPPFASREEALPFIEQALDTWSDIPSARISWRVTGFGPELYRERDRTNAVRVHARDTFASYAALFIVAGEMVECDVNLSPRHAANFESWGMNVLIHEFGHCLGLGHSGIFPTWDSTWRRRSFETALWRQDPKMSYGGDRDHELTEDDTVAASLIRPAPGFVESTGSIAGQVSLDGETARYARVVATLISGSESGFTVNAFTNREGEFLLEGLKPGDYLLAAGTMVVGSAHSRMLDAGAATGADDQYFLRPMRVTAGGVTRAPPVSLRGGRAVSVWVDSQ